MKRPCTVKHKPGSGRQRLCPMCGLQRPTTRADRSVTLTSMPSSGRVLPAEPKLSVDSRGGKKFREEWRLDGERHREDGPAMIEYYENGSPSREEWCLDGERHREDGPAVVDYHENGSPFHEVWYLDGRAHREDGPAVVDYHENGSPFHEVWCLDDKIVSREEVQAFYLTKRFQFVDGRNVGAIDMLLSQGELSELTAEQVESALKVHPNLNDQ